MTLKIDYEYTGKRPHWPLSFDERLSDISSPHSPKQARPIFSEQESGAPSVHASDRFQFGYLWASLKELAANGELYVLIQERRLEIKAQKEHWQERIEEFQKGQDTEVYEKLQKIVPNGKLVRIEEGSGGAYFLKDEKEEIHFVLKPVDEDILCLNNCKLFASPFNNVLFRVRDTIPLYLSAQTDVLCFEVARAANISHITPRAILVVIASNRFYDLTDLLQETEKMRMDPLLGIVDKEKLCSLQEYIPRSRDLFELLHDWIQNELPEEQIVRCLDKEDYEHANLLVWISYDNDAHASNFRAYPKRINQRNEIVYGLKKIDNGLTFPQRNSQLDNFLSTLPHADLPLSAQTKTLIATLPIPKFLQLAKIYEREDCIESLLERIEVLQELAKREGISMREIDLRLKTLCLPHGRALALSFLSQKELEQILYEKKSASTGAYAAF